MISDMKFANLGQLDGGAAGLVADAEIRKAIDDLEDRGAEDGKERKVVFELSMTKVAGGKIASRLSAQAKIPPRRTNDTLASARERAGEVVLIFQTANPDNDEQPTFDDLPNTKGRDA